VICEGRHEGRTTVNNFLACIDVFTITEYPSAINSKETY
jgi:hypothetical protein